MTDIRRPRKDKQSQMEAHKEFYGHDPRQVDYSLAGVEVPKLVEEFATTMNKLTDQILESVDCGNPARRVLKRKLQDSPDLLKLDMLANAIRSEHSSKYDSSIISEDARTIAELIEALKTTDVINSCGVQTDEFNPNDLFTIQAIKSEAESLKTSYRK